MAVQSLPQVVVIGGGTGMPVLLRGLKNLPIHLSALVTVADDGGSTGEIRNNMPIPAPGDIRNVIAALSDAEPMLLKLFQHRFQMNNGLSGHSLGNLLLAAMTTVTGDFYTGIKEISRVLNVKGKIYPISNESLSLHAKMEDGTIISGESKIPLAQKRIKKVFLRPQPVQPIPDAVQAIKQADLVVISPGSLYTSILPNLIIPAVGEAIQSTKAEVVYVCNVMTQLGETTGYTAADHVKAIHDHIKYPCIDAILLHEKQIHDAIRGVYKIKHAETVEYDLERLQAMNLQVKMGDIIDFTERTVVHNQKRVAQLLYSLLEDH